MSTVLREPITSFRVHRRGSHSQVSLWVNHAYVGDLTLRNEEVTAFLLALTNSEVESEAKEPGELPTSTRTDQLPPELISYEGGSDL